MPITLYHSPTAVCAKKVRLALYEKRIDWRSVEVDFADAAFMDFYRRALNPEGVVPTLLVDETPLVESNVILEWLDESFAAPALLPADATGRARTRVWLSRIDIDLHPAINVLSFAIALRNRFLAMPQARLAAMYAAFPDPERRARRQELIERGLQSPLVGYAVARFARLLGDMERRLAQHPFLMGDDYTLADLALTPYCERLIALGYEPIFARYPHLLLWWRRITERENYTRAIIDWGGAEARAEMAPAAAAAWETIKALDAAV